MLNVISACLRWLSSLGSVGLLGWCAVRFGQVVPEADSSLTCFAGSG